MDLMKNVAVFEASARAFISVLERITPAQWDEPGLGVWSVRALAGHTSRAITTVGDYLSTPALPKAECADAEAYYLGINSGRDVDAAVAARGVAAGESLPGNPGSFIASQLDRVLSNIAAQPANRVVSVYGGRTIPLAEYLRTRNFELVVHTIDLSKATGIPHGIPTASMEDACALGARIAARRGNGDTLLLSLTGRRPLPEGFSVV
jgi:uncharacterized protein (TIGR03083 family)